MSIPGGAPEERIENLSGLRVGRYVILREIGRGGMGSVFEAYDPELDRRIAIKILNDPERIANAHARMLREAQAMARLSHPNVLPVHDVGYFRGQVYLAMQLVSGPTLRDWLNETRRTRRQILKVFLAAGRGLAAAHQAGIVHRDFKPGNVLLRTDGRVFVTDFGLARAVDIAEGDENADTKSLEPPHTDPSEPPAAPGGTEAEPPSETPRHPVLSSDITRAGSMLGTPPYMAPEQIRKEGAGPAADQFAFCVALYEALTGVRPFAGKTPEELLPQIAARRWQQPHDRRHALSRRLRRLIERGLSPEPGNRYADMGELLSELDRIANPPSRMVALLGAGAVVLAVAAAFPFWNNARLCSGAEARLAGVWDAERSAALEQVFAADPGSQAAWRQVKSRLDTYASDWKAMHGEACRATRVTGEQSEGLLDARMACLEQRRQDLDATARVLLEGGEALYRSAEAVGGLPRIDTCANVPHLLIQVPPPESRADRRRITELESQLARGRALLRAGRADDAQPIVEALQAETPAIGYAPLTARVLLLQGDILLDQREYEEAIPLFHHAVVEGERGRDSDTRALATLRMATGLAYAGDQDEAIRWTDLVAAAESPAPDVALELEETLATIYFKAEKPHEAIQHSERALALVDSSDRLAVAAAQRRHGVLLTSLGRHDEAEASLLQALKITRAELGDAHPRTAGVLNSLGNMNKSRGKPKEALQQYMQAAEIWRDTLPLSYAMVMSNIAQLHGELREGEPCIETGQRALELRRKLLGKNHPDVARDLRTIGACFGLVGDYEAAADSLNQALRILEDHDRPISLAYTLHEEAVVERNLGRYEDAVRHQTRAIAIVDETVGEGSFVLPGMLGSLGWIHLRRGKPADALAPLERGVRIVETHRAHPMNRGIVRFALAQALVATGQHRDRALDLARAAEKDFADYGDSASAEKVRAFRTHPDAASLPIIIE